jgi:hypothetical protein
MDAETIAAAKEIEKKRAAKWSWGRINKHFHRSKRWAQNTLRSVPLLLARALLRLTRTRADLEKLALTLEGAATPAPTERT